jgi:MOSC domain-containing protein YiiM/GNAT superfamily N-acetyltransferase
MSDGRLLQVNVSEGGVPKLPVEAARVTIGGVEGDRQRAVTVHGGPHRAVSILGIEAIRRVAAEGHPIAPGTTGENLTTEGFDVSSLPVGTRLAIGNELVLELSAVTNPCRTIRHSFRDLRFGRLGVATHPGDSRMYARVIRPGTVRPNDVIRLSQPDDNAAQRFTVADRLDAAERESALTQWQAAATAGYAVNILDDGEIAAAATPSLPGPVFNMALGFAHLPNLVDRAVEHFRAHRTTGWVWASEPPWTDAIVDSTAVYAAASVTEQETDAPLPAGVTIRELGRNEIGAWAETMIAAVGFSDEVALAWRDLEPKLALAPHAHRFLAEVNGRPVATGTLHTHHRVGWLRAGTVLPAARGRGIQRALIAARMAHAWRLGCDIVGASADRSSVSAQNLERTGFEVVAVRQRYRVEAVDSPA